MAAIGTRRGRPLIVGNWKMNGSFDALAELDAIDDDAGQAPRVDMAICLPGPYIRAGRDRVRHLRIGGQDCHATARGAFTGQVSAPMLADCGARLVLLGHSECRSAGEDDDAVAAKVAAALAAGLEPIVCVGERSAGPLATAVAEVRQQLAAILRCVAPDPCVRIAYEPVWAIGSGQQPTADRIGDMLAAIDREIERHWGLTLTTLYGGSVSGDNALDLLRLDRVGGLLVGSASLTAARLRPIVRAASLATL